MELHEPTARLQTHRTVHCGRHGDNREAFMCKHLLHHSRLGFFSDPEEPDNPYPDAWCPACEQERIDHGAAGEFNSDYARANFALVCGECYKEIKAKNVGNLGGNLGTDGTFSDS
jgi:hypothetical protein